MKLHVIRNSALALVTAGLLTGGAIAQKEVAQSPKAEQPTSFQSRDPFINLNLRPQAPDGTRTQPKNTNDGVTKVGDGPKDGPAAASPTIDVEAPDVTITGIVESGHGRQAIAQVGSNSAILSVGQKLGDFTVSSITPGAVTFGYETASFTIPLAAEF